MAAESRLIESICAAAIAGFARLVTGVRGEWRGCGPAVRPRIYFANHRSHADFILLWTVLPASLRRSTRPVAAADYWLKGAILSFIGKRVFQAVLIERRSRTEGADTIAVGTGTDPIGVMADALDGGSSLILFPEGTRNIDDQPLLPFKSGLYHLAKRRPDIELIPVWIENLNRVMPKGEFVPIPLLCTVTIGTPLRVEPDEDKAGFLERSRHALLELGTRRRVDQ